MLEEGRMFCFFYAKSRAATIRTSDVKLPGSNVRTESHAIRLLNMPGADTPEKPHDALGAGFF